MTGMSDTPEEALDAVAGDALAKVVRSRFPEGNLILADPQTWPSPPEASAMDFKVGWLAALQMVATIGQPALNDFEHAIAQKIADLAADFIHLVGDGETAGADFAEILPHLHALQQTVMAQAAARAHPGMYRLLGDPGPDLDDEPEEGLHR